MLARLRKKTFQIVADREHCAFAPIIFISGSQVDEPKFDRTFFSISLFLLFDIKYTLDKLIDAPFLLGGAAISNKLTLRSNLFAVEINYFFAVRRLSRPVFV